MCACARMCVWGGGGGIETIRDARETFKDRKRVMGWVEGGVCGGGGGDCDDKGCEGDFER